MASQGVLTSVNSDSADLARRLNTEAGKSTKYGGMSPDDAIKLVTINPAKQLHIDAKVGSLEPGKDADFVIWSGDPLSNYTHANQTWIDGRKYFDRAEDAEMQKKFAAATRSLCAESAGRARERTRANRKNGDDKKPDGKESPKPTDLYGDGSDRYTCTANDEYRHCSTRRSVVASFRWSLRRAARYSVVVRARLCRQSMRASDEIPAPPQSKPIALKGATIHPVSGPDIANGTIVFDKGKIVSLGANATIPAGAEIDRRYRQTHLSRPDQRQHRPGS